MRKVPVPRMKMQSPVREQGELVKAVVVELARQAEDGSLAIGDKLDDGLFYIEGEVDLFAIVQAILDKV